MLLDMENPRQRRSGMERKKFREKEGQARKL
jgi:hypothetical protein